MRKWPWRTVYGMIDGVIQQRFPGSRRYAQLEAAGPAAVQPISLMDLAAATHPGRNGMKEKSVMEQLKSQPRTEHKSAPKRRGKGDLIWETSPLRK